MSDYPIYEKLETETAAAYAAFCCYRDMGRDRSLDKAWRKNARNPQIKSNSSAPGHWTKWCNDNNWIVRAQAYDLYIEKLERQARESQHLEAIRQYQDFQQQVALSAFKGITKGLKIVTDRIDRLDPKELSADKLFLSLKQLSDTAKVASEIWAETLGVKQIVESLGEFPSDDEN